jgi:hypothetical protein
VVIRETQVLAGHCDAGKAFNFRPDVAIDEISDGNARRGALKRIILGRVRDSVVCRRYIRGESSTSSYAAYPRKRNERFVSNNNRG